MYQGREKCPVCGKSVTRSGTGTLTRHKATTWDERKNRPAGNPEPWCPGGGKQRETRRTLKQNQETAAQYPILQFFKYAHLPTDLQKISAPFCNLAWKMARTLPQNAETSTALRKLLEAKDAAVRSVIHE